MDYQGVIQGKHESENSNEVIQGEDLVLSIDSKIQKYVEDLTRNYKGSIIIMNPDNGEVIALASFPD